jgi:type II secretory pathway component PulK
MNSRLSKTYSKKRRPPNTEAGIALISVLWVLLLLSALAASMAYTARTEAILVHRELDIAEAEAAADAAIIASISNLSDAHVDRHPPINGGEQPWEFANAKIGISISREAGRIDLNKADRNLLLAFLYSRAVEPETAAVLVDQLHDWLVSKGPLRSVDQLKQIPGWSAQPLDCWVDGLTVYTALTGVSSNDAGPLVLAALRLAQERHLGGLDWIISSANTSGLSMEGSILGEVLRISTKAATGDKVTASGVWIGRLTGDRERPTLTMQWDHYRSLAAGHCGD